MRNLPNPSKPSLSGGKCVSDTHRGVAEKILHNIFSSTTLFAKMRQFAARYGENESPIFGKTRIWEGGSPQTNGQRTLVLRSTPPPQEILLSRGCASGGSAPSLQQTFRGIRDFPGAVVFRLRAALLAP